MLAALAVCCSLVAVPVAATGAAAEPSAVSAASITISAHWQFPAELVVTTTGNPEQPQTAAHYAAFYHSVWPATTPCPTSDADVLQLLDVTGSPYGDGSGEATATFSDTRTYGGWQFVDGYPLPAGALLTPEMNVHVCGYVIEGDAGIYKVTAMTDSVVPPHVPSFGYVVAAFNPGSALAVCYDQWGTQWAHFTPCPLSGNVVISVTPTIRQKLHLASTTLARFTLGSYDRQEFATTFRFPAKVLQAIKNRVTIPVTMKSTVTAPTPTTFSRTFNWAGDAFAPPPASRSATDYLGS